MFGVFLVLQECPLIWINAAMISSGQGSFGKHKEAPGNGRHVDSPPPRSADNRQSLSSRTQYRAGHDPCSLDAVCSSSPSAPLAGLATWRDDDPKCGRLYSLLVCIRGSSRPP